MLTELEIGVNEKKSFPNFTALLQKRLMYETNFVIMYLCSNFININLSPVLPAGIKNCSCIILHFQKCMSVPFKNIYCLNYT